MHSEQQSVCLLRTDSSVALPWQTHMNTIFVHTRLANTASWFILILAFWALLQFIRNRPLDGAWMGAAVIAEGLIIVQALLGAWMYWGQGLSVALERGWLHMLYGAVALLSLPASWAYFGGIKDERVRTLAMTATCFWWWGIVVRLSQTGQ